MMNENTIKILRVFFVLVILILGFSSAFGQDKQKDLMESYIGKWCGNVTIQNINRSGGWGNGFLGFHETTKEIWRLYLDVKFLHPFDDPPFIQQCKELGYPVEYIKGLKNLQPIPDELKITGYATLSGFMEYTHETKEYCEECAGKDGTKVKNFPSVGIDISGRVDLIENKILFDFENVPVGYNPGLGFFLQPENIKLVKPDIIEVNFKYFEGPAEGSVDQKVTGGLHKIYIRKCERKDKIPLNILVSTEYKDGIKSFPNGTEVRKTHDKLKIVTKDGCVELYLKDYFKITGSDGTEIEMSISKVLDGVISSELYQGSVQVDIWKDGKHHQFFTKNATLEVKGTIFVLSVEKDGATTLTVLDGKVEFSDINKKKTVIVKENQKSVVKPGGLPSEPISVDSGQIPKWWE